MDIKIEPSLRIRNYVAYRDDASRLIVDYPRNPETQERVMRAVAGIISNDSLPPLISDAGNMTSDSGVNNRG